MRHFCEVQRRFDRLIIMRRISVPVPSEVDKIVDLGMVIKCDNLKACLCHPWLLFCYVIIIRVWQYSRARKSIHLVLSSPHAIFSNSVDHATRIVFITPHQSTVHTKLASESMLFSLPNTHSIQNCISNKPTNPNKLWASTPVSSVPSRAPSPSAVQSPPVSLNQAEEAHIKTHLIGHTCRIILHTNYVSRYILEKASAIKCKHRMWRKL